MFADSYIADATQFDALVEPSRDVVTGYRVDPAALADYEAVFGRELQAGECGGTSCPPEYEARLEFDTSTPFHSGKVHFDRQTGGGHRVLRSKKSLS